MAVSFEVIGVIPAEPEIIYQAWLNSKTHSAMTGGQAHVSDRVGASFNAWDGYIQGVNLELEPPSRILQHWRTTEFVDGDEDSLLEVLLEPDGEKTKVTIRHSNLPDHGMQYQQGWIDAYFNPMMAFFGRDSAGTGS